MNNSVFILFVLSLHVPGRTTLRGSLLDRNYDADIAENHRLLALPGIIHHVKNYGPRNSHIFHSGIDKFGLALTTDGASIRRHAMMNVMSLSVVFQV